MRRLIAFLTDYGTRDGFVAVCHGILARSAPDTRVLDVSHDVPPQNVRHGAAVLARVAPYLPPAIYVGVVDPGVGTSRRGVALLAGPSLLLGPDNGLLIPAAEILGGVRQAYALTNVALWLPDVDPTFHGRDVFAPVAGHLASGGEVGRVGEPLPPAELVRLPAPRCELAGDALTAEVTYLDRFGNVQLAGGPAELAAVGALGTQGTVDVQVGDLVDHAQVGRTFADVAVGELVVYLDSDGRLALAVNCGDAGVRLNAKLGDLVRLVRPT
ncbi:SAM-dependent chlorinase/fluorinase [Actinopolymorpha sp. B17G11]|uniref:SAM hydrolase/SAM-dependent halogenase family protein n=1 Tax=unclassified Actinopolymorpha TaxID=2627063 RepID=UPI0032D96837